MNRKKVEIALNWSGDIHPLITAYLETPFVKSVALVGRGTRRGFTSNIGRRPGIHSTLRKRFFKRYVNSKRSRKTNKRGSSRKIGTAVDKAITKYVKTGKLPRGRMARRLILHWTTVLGHIVEATQLPVYVKKLNCITQADVITKNAKGELFMWEVKTGYPPGGYRKKGVLTGTKIPSTKYNHWELQRLFTWTGLAGPLQICRENTYVIQAYENHIGDEATMCIKAHARPEWTLGF